MVRRHGKRGQRKERPGNAIRRELPQDQAVRAERGEIGGQRIVKRSRKDMFGRAENRSLHSIMKSDGSAEEKKSMDEKAMETSSVTQKQAGPESGRRLRGFALFSVLGALMLTLLLEALDQTVVGTALPRIIGSLQGFDRYTWAVTPYTLPSSLIIPTVGKLSDQFGRKWFLIAGTVLFLAGSALAGASQTMNELIAFRAMQGLGAGIGIALVLTVVG